eukprot:scaffold96040_cov21-Tisochrysis_lutea.AAC.1
MEVSVSVVESAKDEQLCEVKVCCKPVLEDGGRDKVKKYTRWVCGCLMLQSSVNLTFLGQLRIGYVCMLHRDKIRQALNSSSLSLVRALGSRFRELDQRAGRRDPAPQLPSSVGDDIALKPHWLRAGSGGAGTLYRSSSSDTKGSPIPPAGPLRSRLVDGAGDGGGEPMSSSLPASGNRTSERNASGMQRGWRLSNDKDRDGSSIVPRSPQHSYEAGISKCEQPISLRQGTPWMVACTGVGLRIGFGTGPKGQAGTVHCLHLHTHTHTHLLTQQHDHYSSAWDARSLNFAHYATGTSC